MKQENKLKEVAGSKAPFMVPENYFESFKENLIADLPQYPAKPVAPQLSFWQKCKPYVYLAAMFAGIWCMMQIFHHAGGLATSQKPQTEMAEIYVEPDSYDFYIDESSGEDIELQDEVTDLYSSFDDFKRDFYAATIE